jgi:glyoxylase I family protein
MIRQIAHVCISAADLKEAERFYCEVLGLTVSFRFRRGDETVGLYLNAGGGTYIEIFPRKGDETGNAPIRHLCIQVSDLADTVERVRRHGVAVTEPKKGCDGSWQAWITDPSGVRIEFHEYTPLSSQLTGADCVVDW